MGSQHAFLLIFLSLTSISVITLTVYFKQIFMQFTILVTYGCCLQALCVPWQTAICDSEE